MNRDLPKLVSKEQADSAAVGDVAHDLASLLKIIDAFAVHVEEALQQSDGEPGEVLEAVATLRHAVKRGEVRTLHATRHTVGTMLYRATKDLRLVQKHLGHSRSRSRQSTLRRALSRSGALMPSCFMHQPAAPGGAWRGALQLAKLARPAASAAFLWRWSSWSRGSQRPHSTVSTTPRSSKRPRARRRRSRCKWQLTTPGRWRCGSRISAARS